jgi:3-oxoacyl-[acyl-carrier-protein] synthase-3
VPETLATTRRTAGLGIAVPARVVTNEPIAARLGVDPEWIVQRTGIRERRVTEPEGRLSDLAARAALEALADAAFDPADLDLLLVATTTADEVTPAAAPLVARDIGAVNAGAIDVGAACTGFLAGLSLAAAQLDCGRARSVLLVGADILHRYTDPDDRRTAALFGDGAGALLLTSDGPAIGPVVLRADGDRDLLFATRERHLIEMDGHEVFKHAVTRMSEATLEACALTGIALDEIDLFVYHQANRRILDAVGRRLKLDPGRVVDCIAAYGNTSAASIPLALDHARRDGRLHEGSRVLVSAFGAGFTWGATIVDWKTA